ncbi:hypothetical protein EVAR_101422_1 [Eumeta japonica]|uniref:Uncharacterized protein n=1 Tax=Eumeta variegata TaxID=151549 RepID=A0A4C1SHG0_EUMVA|nr:hypothetical protein EVAR_101422_1 [Eumeta japonica]
MGGNNANFKFQLVEDTQRLLSETGLVDAIKKTAVHDSTSRTPKNSFGTELKLPEDLQFGVQPSPPNEATGNATQARELDDYTILLKPSQMTSDKMTTQPTTKEGLSPKLQCIVMGFIISSRKECQINGIPWNAYVAPNDITIIELFPRLTELYDETCLMGNPFFKLMESAVHHAHE